MMKIAYKRTIYIILVLIWMITIYCFSNQNGEQSQGTSDIITNKIVDVLSDYFDIKNINQTTETVSFIVRKVAHFSIYFIGGILIFNLINTFSIKNKYVIILTIVFGMIYAMSDELHQYFIAERSAQVRDVLIDTSGIICSTIIRNIIKNRNIRKGKERT